MDMLRATPAIRRDPLGFLQDVVARHGDLVAFPVPGPGVLLVNDPDGARRVLLAGHRRYSKRTLQYSALAEITGSGLLTADGEGWLRHRRILQPAFHQRGLPAVGRIATAAGRRLRSRWDDAPGLLLDADEALVDVLLEVVGETLFDTDLAPVADRLGAAVQTGLTAVIGRAASPVPSGWPTPARRRLRRAVRVLDRIAADVVRGHRPGGSDVLGLLLAADGLTGREIRDELLTMIIAGHETVASCLVWTLDLLADRPDVQRRLAAELDAVPTAEATDPSRLPYTRAVVAESLRLYPPAWLITRRAIEDDELVGASVPAGSTVIISPWLLHRRPSSWPDPLRFDPDRFLATEGAAGRSAAPTGDYLPFGVGPRLCIGRDVALVQAVLLLAALLRDRRVLRPSGLHRPQAEPKVTLRPRGGLPLLLVPI